MPDYSIHVDVPLVNVDVLVTTKDGQFISSLKKDNFRIIEDGVPQPITNFTISQAPITAVLLVEFASTNYYFMVDALHASYAFANTLKKDDWVAVISYDMKPHILVDFTQDKQAVAGALNQLRIPGFAETNLFDALYDTLDRMDRSRATSTSFWSAPVLTPSASSISTRSSRRLRPLTTSPFSPSASDGCDARVLRNPRLAAAPTAWAFPSAKWITCKPTTKCRRSPA